VPPLQSRKSITFYKVWEKLIEHVLSRVVTHSKSPSAWMCPENWAEQVARTKMDQAFCIKLNFKWPARGQRLSSRRAACFVSSHVSTDRARVTMCVSELVALRRAQIIWLQAELLTPHTKRRRRLNAHMGGVALPSQSDVRDLHCTQTKRALCDSSWGFSEIKCFNLNLFVLFLG